MPDPKSKKNWFSEKYWKIDTSDKSYKFKKQYRQFCLARYAIAGGVMILFFYISATTMLISTIMIIWGYQKCKHVFPYIEREITKHGKIDT